MECGWIVVGRRLEGGLGGSWNVVGWRLGGAWAVDCMALSMMCGNNVGMLLVVCHVVLVWSLHFSFCLLRRYILVFVCSVATF